MCQWVLKANGKVVPRRTVRPLKPDEQHSNVELEKRTIFDKCIHARWGTSQTPPPSSSDPPDEFEEYEYSEETSRQPVDATGRVLDQQPAYDKLINAEIAMNLDCGVSYGKVKGRIVGADGRNVGTYDDNPVLNSLVYEVEFSDGRVKEYSANVIAENMMTQVDAEGFTVTMVDGIVDHKVDHAVAVPKTDAYIVSKRGVKRRRKTTQGWKLLI